jgi:hypothetical protein
MFQNCKCLMKTKEKKTDLNKSIGPSPSVMDEKNEPCIVDKDNSKWCFSRYMLKLIHSISPVCRDSH